MSDPEKPGTPSGDAYLGIVLADRYRIDELIGEGGMGKVYRAHQLGTVERPVAIKLLQRTIEGSETAVRRFENEARIIAQLRHPSTLKLIDVGKTAQGVLFLVTELLLGKRLDRVLAEGPLSARRTIVMLRQMLGALAEAHAMGVVHRDIKPTNVVLEKIGGEELVKVLDFGIAKLLSEPGLTAPMTFLGTAGYMAPEQMRTGKVDARSDLYAIGAVAYECLCGRKAFEGDRLVIVTRQLRDAPAPLRSLVPADKVPDELCDVVMKLLEREPSARFQSAAEVSDLLGKLVDKVPDEPAPRAPSQFAAPALGSDERPTERDVLPTTADRGRRS
jgi:eukaryotic-like serine/threonine-protein kinase